MYLSCAVKQVSIWFLPAVLGFSRVGNDICLSTMEMSYGNFNPRSRVGNDAGSRCLQFLRPISIHVTAWGTTLSYGTNKNGLLISIHVPAWGTTKWRRSKKEHTFIFQSTFPRGERRRPAESHCTVCLYFNPRSRVGNDFRASGCPSLSMLFQSTFPRGVVLEYKHRHEMLNKLYL